MQVLYLKLKNFLKIFLFVIFAELNDENYPRESLSSITFATLSVIIVT
jgi:hypothetical protein